MSSSPTSTSTAEEILQVCSTGPLSTLLTLLARASAPPPTESMAHTAAQHGQVDILQHFLSPAGGGVSIDDYLAKAAVKSGSRPILKVLLDAGMDINIDFGHMGNPYLYSIVCHHPKAYTEWVFAQGANPNLATIGFDGRSGLAMFSFSGPTELIRMLLLHGARAEGSGALQIAADLGRTDIVRVLVEEGGAAVNEVVDLDEFRSVENERGAGTALHEAAREGRMEVAGFLLGKGADVGAKDSKGRTAREIAERAGKGEVVEFLRKWEEDRS